MNKVLICNLSSTAVSKLANHLLHEHPRTLHAIVQKMLAISLTWVNAIKNHGNNTDVGPFVTGN